MNDRPVPNPDRSPEGVLRTVLSALRTNDEPREDAGIATAFEFCSPSYRADVGESFEAFRDHLTDRIHGTLVDHRTAKRGRLLREGDRATERVVVTGDDGDTATYEFSLVRVDDGERGRCWLVDDLELAYVGESPDHRHVPLVEFDGTEVKCEEGAVLRDVLLRASGVSPHDDAKYANCNGNGVCGTCAVEVVDGEVSEKTAREKRRLRLPPHRDADPDVRLSCQCRVLDDVRVRKHEATWGRHVREYAADAEAPDAQPVGTARREYGPPDDGPGTGRTDPRDRSRVVEEAEELLDETESALEE